MLCHETNPFHDLQAFSIDRDWVKAIESVMNQHKYEKKFKKKKRMWQKFLKTKNWKIIMEYWKITQDKFLWETIEEII